MALKFEWDERKNHGNFRKHGIWFEEAQTIWTDSAAIEFFDPEHSVHEERFVRIGHSIRANLLLVVFCERDSGGILRIISARRATNAEGKQYEEGI